MIKVKNLNYIYQEGMPDQRQALFDISLDFDDGKIYAIIGHTGSGKSTLIEHFNGLVRPTSGKIYIDNSDITDKKTKFSDIRKSVGLVFQYPEYQLFEETVYLDIAFGPKNLGLSKEEIDTRVRYAARLLDIDERLFQKSPFELSGGQKRRVAIAGVLAMRPSVLILDEPTAGLDPRGREKILKIIKNLHTENPKMIIIFVSHSMEDVAKTADEVIVLNKGRICMSGCVDEVFKHSETLQSIGLDIPEISKLMHELSVLGVPVNPDIYTIDGAYDNIKKILLETNN
ncbi:MAG: energy-coupling factor transporter ATPase [Clostridia bacterium]|nr:energy-coupling factor transporter ATPase [Clostridia bacterium]